MRSVRVASLTPKTPKGLPSNRTGRRAGKHGVSVVYLLLLGACISATVLARTADAQTAWRRHVIDDSSRGADGVRLADFNHDGKLDIVTGWEQGGVVRVCLQPAIKDLRERWPSVTVGKAPSVEDAVAVDLDGDGQLDVVSSCEGKTKSLFVHWSPDSKHILDAERWRTEAMPVAQGKQAWMYALPMQVDGQHGVDLVVGSKGTHGAIGWCQAPSDPRDLSAWKYHRLIDAGWIMSLIRWDMDGDGDEDVLFSDRRNESRGVKWLELPNDPADRAKPWPVHVIGATDREVMFLAMGDLNKDGQAEIVAATRNRHIDIFRRSTSNARDWARHSVENPWSLPHGKSVAVGDMSGNGRVDLVSTMRSVPPDGPAVAVTEFSDGPYKPGYHHTDIGGPEGSKFDLIELLDLDNDGDLDVITCEEVSNLGVIWYENPGKVGR